MKIKNLADYPQQLGDGRVIGASDQKSDEREYGLPELTKQDKQRVKNGSLTVIEEEEKPEPKTESESAKTPAPVNPKGGNK